MGECGDAPGDLPPKEQGRMQGTLEALRAVLPSSVDHIHIDAALSFL